MAPYRAGVLIHNFNEDRFGEDLLRIRAATKKEEAVITSVSRTAYRDPRVVEAEESARASSSSTDKGNDTSDFSTTGDVPTATTSLDAHLLFGHSGNMVNTDGLKSRAHVSACRYFYQKPEVCANPTQLDRSRVIAEEFYKTEPPPLYDSKLNHSHCRMYFGLEEGMRKKWNNEIKESNSYKTEMKVAWDKESMTSGLEKERKARINGEFTRAADSVRMMRQM